jgi:hypothetical protein
MRKILFKALCGVLLMSFSSCAARISGALQSNGAGEFSLRTDLQPKMMQLMQSLSRGGGTVFDGEKVSRSLNQAGGISRAKLVNTAPNVLEGSIGISSVEELLAVPLKNGTMLRLISYTHSATSGKITFTLDRVSGPQILAFLSQDIADYLTTLFAPVASGEKMTKVEYLDEINQWYPGGLADEIKSARITARMKVPGQINRIKGGKSNGSEAVFEAQLLDLLVLEEPLTYEVQWTPFR